jgi:hypothetical protein
MKDVSVYIMIFLSRQLELAADEDAIMPLIYGSMLKCDFPFSEDLKLTVTCDKLVKILGLNLIFLNYFILLQCINDVCNLSISHIFDLLFGYDGFKVCFNYMLEVNLDRPQNDERVL